MFIPCDQNVNFAQRQRALLSHLKWSPNVEYSFCKMCPKPFWDRKGGTFAPKAASEIDINIGSWAVNSDNQYDFKISDLHCTPLEFRTGFSDQFSLLTQQQANKTKQLQRSRRCSAAVQLLNLMSSDEVMDWLLWSVFPGLKTPRLWVALQCRSLTPVPTSRRGRHIAASVAHSLRGGKSADQNRPPVCWPLSKTADLAAKRTGKLATWCPV